MPPPRWCCPRKRPNPTADRRWASHANESGQLWLEGPNRKRRKKWLQPAGCRRTLIKPGFLSARETQASAPITAGSARALSLTHFAYWRRSVCCVFVARAHRIGAHDDDAAAAADAPPTKPTGKAWKPSRILACLTLFPLGWPVCCARGRAQRRRRRPVRSLRWPPLETLRRLADLAKQTDDCGGSLARNALSFSHFARTTTVLAALAVLQTNERASRTKSAPETTTRVAIKRITSTNSGGQQLISRSPGRLNYWRCVFGFGGEFFE